MGTLHSVRLLNGLPVPMRDGIELSADVYVPRAPGKWPVILVRTPYGNHLRENPNGWITEATFFAQRGYAVAVVDNRGRYDSAGDWTPWFDDFADGADTVEWCGTQPWSNGNVGMIGGSYLGCVQWWAAQSRSPYLKTIIPFSAHADIYFYGMNYRGGAFKLAGNLIWATMTNGRVMQPAIALAASNGTIAKPEGDDEGSPIQWDEVFEHLPLITSDEVAVGRVIPFYRNWVQHSTYDDYWKEVSNFGKYDRIDIPVLLIGGWFDVHVVSTIANLEGIHREGGAAARAGVRLVMGPWGHGVVTGPFGDLDFGPDSVVEFRELQLRWLDHWLKGINNGVEKDPPLRLFTMGTNTWREGSAWPLPETRWTKLYLGAGGRLAESEPGEHEEPDRYVYDPADPVPTLGPNPWDDRPLDHRAHEERADVLVYTTDPLTDDLEVTGPVQARLFAASSAPDTDWTVRLLDVHPDGRAISLCDGILRARFREPAPPRTGVPAPGQFEHPRLLTPGLVHEFTVEVGVTSIVFKRGHRIRIHVSSSNFPRFDRNLNSGSEPGTDSTIVVAHQTIYHEVDNASYLELPIILPAIGRRQG